MIKRLGLLVGLLFAAPAAASDWYISPSSPFTSRTIEGTQCRYLRMDSTDSGYTPALDTHTISKAKFQHDWNAKVTGTGASVMLKSCSSPTDTNTCTNFQADLNGDNVFEDASLTTDIEFYAATPPQYLRAQIATPATVPAITTVVVCGWTGSVPLSEIDPLFQAMDTEAELEAHLHGLNVWTEADGPLGGGGGGSSPTDIAQGTRTSTTVPITSSTGADATLTAATTSLAGVMTATDKTKLDGIAAGATVGLGSDPSACPAGQVVNDQNQSGVLVCVNDDDVPESGDFGNAVGLTSTGAIKAGAVSIASISATGTPSGSTFLRGDGVWAVPAGGGTGISSLFDDPNPMLSANLDINYFDLVNLDRVGGAIYFAKTQAEAEAALARIPSNYGGSNSTGATIQLACGPMTWDGFRFSAANSQSDSHSGIELRGCGPGGNVASNGTGAGGSTTLQATAAQPMIAYGSCSSCKVSNVVIDGNDVATVGIDMDDTAGGFPNTQSIIEDVHIHHVNGPAIRTGYYTVAAASLTRSGTTATFDSSINHLSNTGDIVEITGASDPLYNGKFNITVVDADTFTYPVSASAAASATGAAFFSQTAPQIQVDTFTVRNAILASNDLCYRQLHSQSIGGVFDDVSCTNSNGTEPGGLEGLDIRAGELTYNNSYFGSTPGHDGNIFINRGWQSGRMTVRNTQVELHGTTGFYVVKDDDQSAIYNNAPVGSTLWANFIWDSNQVVYNEPGNCFSVKREGTYTVTNNRFDDQGGGGHACDSNFASDMDPYPQDRLELIEYGNLYTAGLPGTYPGSWHPTLASDVDLMLTSISSDSPPDDCVIGQIWVDTNATTGQRLHTCELVTGTPTWVAQAGGSGEAAVFQVSAYGTGISAINAALNACYVAGGGTVKLPIGNTTIDGSLESGEVIILPTDSTFSGNCDLVGYGSTLPADSSTTLGGGSSITITNAAGLTGIRVNGSGQILKDFTLQMLGTDASSIGVDISSSAGAGTCDGACAKGERGIRDWLIDNVVISGPTFAATPTGSGPGIGLDLTFALKGAVIGGEIQKWDSGVHYSASIDNSPPIHSNANTWINTKIRANDVGMLFDTAETVGDVALFGSTIEGNDVGISATLSFNGSGTGDAVVNDFGSHLENRTNDILIASTYFNFNGNGTQIVGGGVSRNAVSVRLQPDLYSGVLSTAQFNYTNGAQFRVINGAVNAQTSIVGAGALGSFGFHATDCDGAYGTRTQYQSKLFRGDGCFQRSDSSIWICDPDDPDGQCDSASDWTQVAGAGTSNSFETQNVTAGTDPVADASNDILNWTTGTGITFTGDSTTDTIDVTLASALVDLADGTLSGSAVQQFGTSNAGAVPSSGGGTTNYLRADGTWAAPGGSGTVTTSGTPANTNIALFSGSTVITGESDLTYNTTTNALDVNGPLTANSIVADPTTTPSVDFDDSDDTGTIDAQILVDCPTAGDCYMAFLADAGGTSTEVFRVQTPDTGTQSLRMTAAAAPPTPAANTISVYAKDGTPDLLCAKDSAGAETCMGTGSSSPFTLSGDTGSESIADGNTMSVLGGTNGIDTVVSATDTVTLNIDLTELSGTASSLTAGTATNAVNVGTAAAGAISAASIPLVTTTTGNQAVLTDPGITYNTTSNALSVGSVITADPGDGSRRSTFTTNTTSVDAPSAGECNLGFVGTVLYKHCNGESQAAIDTAGSGDNVNVNGSSTVDPNFTSTGSEITLVNTSNVITFTINDNVTVSGWSGDTAAVNDNDTSLATTAFVQAETVATGEVTGTLGGGFTIADTVTVTGWTMGASVATTPAVDDGDTSLATTLFVQNETVASGDVTGTLGTGFQIAGDVVAAAEINETTNYTWTGVHDFGGGTLEVPNSITLPATCTVGQIYMDTDATTGQRMYACQATNTWALQGDGGGGGSAAGSDTQVQFNDGGTAFGGDAGLTYNKTTDALTVAGTTTIGTVSDPADAGAIRLDNNTSIGWESAPTGTDVTITVDASELVQIAGGFLDGADINANSVPDSVVSDTLTSSLFVGSGSSTTAVDLGTAEVAGALTVDKGGNGAAPGADDQVFVSSSTSAGAWAGIPDCGEGGTLNYAISTNSFSCLTDAGAGGGISYAEAAAASLAGF